MQTETITTNSEAQTAEVASRFAARLKSGSWVGLIGPLGAGKSVFARGIGQALGVQEAMPSPSYTILNCYRGRLSLYHIDLYRLGSPDELDFAGLDPYFSGDGVCLVEWADKIPNRWPSDGWIVELQPGSATQRRISIRGLRQQANGTPQ